MPNQPIFMRYILFLAVCFSFLFANLLQAQEPRFIDLVGHSRYVIHATFSPDSKTVVTSGRSDETARMWDVETGSELKQLVKAPVFSMVTRTVRFATFSPDGKRVAVGVENNVLIFDAESGKELGTLEKSGYWAQVRPDATFSPDSTKVVSHDGGHIRISDVESGKELTMLVGHTNTVNSVVFSSDGKRVLTSSQDGTARIWDVETGSASFGKELKRLGGRIDRAYFAVFSPDGKRAITNAWNEVKIWDTETGERLKTLKVPSNSMSMTNFTAFSPDSKKIISGGFDTVVIWDAETGEELKKIEVSGGVVDNAVSPDGKKVLALFYDNTAQIWDVESGSANFGKELYKLEGPKMLEEHGSSMHVAFSPDSKKVVMVGNNVKIARIWFLE
jgi:WD40 repeat protein